MTRYTTDVATVFNAFESVTRILAAREADGLANAGGPSARCCLADARQQLRAGAIASAAMWTLRAALYLDGAFGDLYVSLRKKLELAR